ncbi:hypothetical protein [Thiomicrorhabdus indica]|uniref:hypothetical protein n=1 Tax=Thiomicrorhabdus indica TaxID=2267253 RepID=UPI00102DECED|nr:hypothetical protein [Thiomicrorhabdus indica]
MHRITAKYIEDNDDFIVLDISIDSELKPKKMFLFGYANEGIKGQKWPLIIEQHGCSSNAQITWGAYEENTVKSTINIFDKKISINEMFTRFDHDTVDNTQTEYVYRITKIEKLD